MKKTKKQKPRRKITERLVSAEKPKDAPYQIHDAEVRGFMLRVQPSGVKTFYFDYYVEVQEGDKKKRKLRRVHIGRATELKAERAREKAEALRAYVSEGGDPVGEEQERKQGFTLREYLEQREFPWLEANRPKSYKATRNRLISGFQPLLDKKLTDLAYWDFAQHRSWRLKHPLKEGGKIPSPATVNRDCAHLRAALTRARKARLILENPLRDVERGTEDRNREIRALTDAEEKKLFVAFAALRDEAIAERDRLNAERAEGGHPPLPPIGPYMDFLEPLVVVALDSGLRRGELFNLQWADVDPWARTIKVHGAKAKSHQTRIVGMTTRVAAALSKWREQTASEGHVFTQEGQPLRAIDKRWHELLTKAQIVDFRFHDCRHTCATRLVSAGKPIHVVKKVMGHSSITTTMRYLHATDKEAIEAMTALEKP